MRPGSCKSCDTHGRGRRTSSRSSPPSTDCPQRVSTASVASLAMDDDWLQRLYQSIDTETRAKLLMEDRLLHPEFPHHRPQNGTRRSTINLTMFSDRRSAVGYHRVQWSSNRADVVERLEAAASRCVRASIGRFGTRRRGRTIAEALDDAKRVAGDRRARPASTAAPRRDDLRPDAVRPCGAGHGGVRRAGRRVRSGDRRPGRVRRRTRGRCTTSRSTSPTRTSPTACSSTTACTGFAARTSGTSCSSRRRSPTSPRSCSTRTTAARRRSSTPPTR